MPARSTPTRWLASFEALAGPVASFTGDGAYDQDGVFTAVAERHPVAAAIMPPHPTGVPSQTAETEPTQRDRHRQFTAERPGRKPCGPPPGLKLRLPSAGSDRRSGAGCAYARTRVGEPRWSLPPMSSIACWSWDARSPSASPEREHDRVHCDRPVARCNTAAIRPSRLLRGCPKHGSALVPSSPGSPTRRQGPVRPGP